MIAIPRLFSRWNAGKLPVQPLVFYACLLVMVGPLLLRKIHANDCWKALYSGRYLAWFHQFPHHSTFTFSPVVDRLPRDAFTWLGNLVLTTVHQGFGIPGLQVLRILVGLGALFLVHCLFRYRRDATVFLLLVLFAWGIGPKLQVRTAMFAVPGLLLLLLFWHRAVGQNRILWIYAFPPLLTIWSNLHGSYMLGVIALGLLVTGEGINRIVGGPRKRRGRLLRLTLVLLASGALVVFLKPFPDDRLPRRIDSLVTRTVSSLSLEPEPQGSAHRISSRRSIHREGILSGVRGFYRNFVFPERPFRSREFAFPLDHPEYLFVLISLGVGVGVGGYFILGGLYRRADLVLLYLGILILGMGYLRTMPYIPLVSVPLVAMGNKEPAEEGGGVSWLSGGLVVLLFLGGLNSGLRGGLSNLTGQPHHEMGIGVVSRFQSQLPTWMLRHDPSSRAFNSYNLGSYLVWVWWPHRKVFVDTKSSAYTRDFWRTITEKGFDLLLDRQRLTRALLLRESPAHRQFFAPSRRWTQVRSDGSMVLYRRIPRRGNRTLPYPSAMVSVERRSSSVIGFIK